jgi:hypothetical protein
MTFNRKHIPQDNKICGSVDLNERSRDSYQSYSSARPNDLASQKRTCNERLRFLFELDKKREEQLKKDYEALEARKKQQEEETQKRINIKRALADTDYISKKNIKIVPSSPLYYHRNPITNTNKMVFSHNHIEF